METVEVYSVPPQRVVHLNASQWYIEHLDHWVELVTTVILAIQIFVMKGQQSNQQ